MKSNWFLSMKNCGGGISVKSKECKLMVSKYRTTEEALDQLESHVLKLKLAT